MQIDIVVNHVFFYINIQSVLIQTCNTITFTSYIEHQIFPLFLVLGKVGSLILIHHHTKLRTIVLNSYTYSRIQILYSIPGNSGVIPVFLGRVIQGITLISLTYTTLGGVDTFSVISLNTKHQSQILHIGIVHNNILTKNQRVF